MAGKKNEKTIPVFTVLKNNAILKNIFLVDNPPPFPDRKPIEPMDCLEIDGTPIQEMEETLLVGRHPDCNITLEHPSISRYHLRIHSNPSSHNLSVTDLSSVHGTWVSRKKIEAWVRVEMNEGDTMQLGGSSRVYRLHWVPLSRAYDTENPFVSPLDVSVPIKEEEEEGTDHDENCLFLENYQIQSLDHGPVCMDSGFSEDSFNPLLNDVAIPLAPQLPKYINSLLISDDEIEYNSHSKTDHEHMEISSVCSGGQQSPQPSAEILSNVKNWKTCIEWDQQFNFLETIESSFSHEQFENQCPLREEHHIAEELQIVQNQDPLVRHYEQREILESVNSSSPLDGLSHIGNQQFNKANRSPHTPFSSGGSQKENPQSPLMNSKKSILGSIWSIRGKSYTVLQIQTGRSREKSKGANRSAEVELPHQVDIEDKEISKSLSTISDGNEPYTPDRENFTPNTPIVGSMKNMGRVEETKDPMLSRSFSLKSSVISKGILTDLDDKEEPFTPDKENFTPNTLLLRSMKKKCKMEENKHSNILKSSSSEIDFNHNHSEEDKFSLSVKKNQTPKLLKESKSLKRSSRNQENLKPEVMPMKSRIKRVPFQSLLENSCGKSKSDASVLNATTENNNSVNYVPTIEKKKSTATENKRWTMVVDTSCFLNKESRKALHLLLGLKGTRLIIPRIVIRELHCLKGRGSLFRRKTDVSSALQWIEECMVSTNWWIHVQSSEEGRPIVPTPPTSLKSHLSEIDCGFPGGGAASLLPFSPWRNLFQIVSPATEDHILEDALLFRRTVNHGQLVLLTNDVTMKVKSIAEGLICETAEEFRESLVNPFSERFLWTDSSPRGLTWSWEDDFFLREKYCSGRMGKLSKYGHSAKGLKLILLQNSPYNTRF